MPKPLFRFSKREHAESLIEAGNLRIGTARSFRPADGKAGGRADELEGLTRFRPPPGAYMGADADRLRPRFQGSAGGFDFGHEVSFEFDVDCFILSLTARVTKRIVRRMAADFGYDACVEIIHIGHFLQEITSADRRLQHPFSDKPDACWNVKYVEYRMPRERGRFPDGDMFLKRPDYAWQEEVRATWPGSGTLEPIILSAPAARAYVRPVDLTPWT